MSKLYIVSTPIGNLGDITHRAVEVLSSADRVLAEDTRRSGVLLRRYGIDRALLSAHAFNEASRSRRVVEWLDAGENVALVSDAGTPLISDPGDRLVRDVLAAGHEVVPVPGPSSVFAALVGAGLPAVPFTFFGFLPRSGAERRRVLEQVARLEHTAVLFEAPGRLLRSLRDLEAACGAERRAVVARELTKLHETFVRGTLGELVAYYTEQPARGEVVVMVGGASGGRAAERADEAVALARSLLTAGERPSAVARELTRRLGVTRNEAYSIAHSAMEGEVD